MKEPGGPMLEWIFEFSRKVFRLASAMMTHALNIYMQEERDFIYRIKMTTIPKRDNKKKSLMELDFTSVIIVFLYILKKVQFAKLKNISLLLFIPRLHLIFNVHQKREG